MLMKELQERQHVAPPIQTSALHVQQWRFPAVNLQKPRSRRTIPTFITLACVSASPPGFVLKSASTLVSMREQTCSSDAT